jgi:hypothetical protein
LKAEKEVERLWELIFNLCDEYFKLQKESKATTEQAKDDTKQAKDYMQQFEHDVRRLEQSLKAEQDTRKELQTQRNTLESDIAWWTQQACEKTRVIAALKVHAIEDRTLFGSLFVVVLAVLFVHQSVISLSVGPLAIAGWVLVASWVYIRRFILASRGVRLPGPDRLFAFFQKAFSEVSNRLQRLFCIVHAS